MPRKRTTPSREELARLARRKRVVDAFLAGASAATIARKERISPATVSADLRAASDVILPAGTKEQLLARNFERLEAVIRSNRDAMEKGDDVATRNVTKAISEQNRMLGVNGAVNFTVNAGQEGDGSINWDIDGSVGAGRTITFVTPNPRVGEPPPEPPRYHSPQPKLIEHRPAQAAPPPNPPLEPPSPEPESGPRTELDGGLRPGWVMDLPPTLKRKHWME